MTVKEHYDAHLGDFYSWFTGNFEKNKESFKTFCLENNIYPDKSKYAIDLGAGNGIQSIALAELGFNVKAIDFNNQLRIELKSNAKQYPIDIINDDIRQLKNYSTPAPELIACCGDTLPHLDSSEEIQKLISDAYSVLTPGGKIILSFRDYSTALDDTARFIPVKSDSQRILTCFLEYYPEKVRVTDLLHEKENGVWMQKVSSYFKIRISNQQISKYLLKAGFLINKNEMTRGFVTIIGSK